MDWLSEFGQQCERAWAYVTTGRVLATILGAGFALLAISLFIASRTKWGQAKPLTKCVVVSVLLHVWLLMYALGTPKVLPQGDLQGPEQNISVSIETQSWELADAAATVPAPDIDASSEPVVEVDADATLERDVIQDSEQAVAPAPWERPVPLADLPQPPELESLDLASDLAPELLPALEPTPMPALPPPEVLSDLLREAATSDEAQTHDSSAQLTSNSATPAVSPSPQQTPEPTPPAPSLDAPNSIPHANVPAQSVAANHSPILPPQRQLAATALPKAYQLRQAPNRLQLAQAFGADADSEAAVQAGLSWLASAQATSGAWIASHFGGGTETYALGENRYNTGAKADTGVSGLALLAFLSAGHTHLEGDYQAVVQRGLEYLLDAQMPSGDLSGPKQVGSARDVMFARMYCHSIATLALAEAYAMTLDAGLKPALLKATQYSIEAQDVRGGGWRYFPGDPGDLSQFGWQAMALKSVEQSGIRIPTEVHRLMRRFLDSCAAGQGGLATYRPRRGVPSHTMTAEALACRLLLDYPLSAAAQHEATSYIMSHLPGQAPAGSSPHQTEAQDNVYYWYYATLALFQLQDENWRTWNQALKARLLETQIPAYGKQPGSWNPDGVWGGYGGRVYSTAMSCLCLEVYYRYLPMYQRSQLARSRGTNQLSR